MLQPIGPGASDPAYWSDWQQRVLTWRQRLGWPAGEAVARPHQDGVTLALQAPADQLFTATEVNECAWAETLVGRSLETTWARLHAPGHPACWDHDLAWHSLQRAAAAEACPHLMKLLASAAQRGLPTLLDDEQLSIGMGRSSRSWPLDTLPAPESVPWYALESIPTALVTGSNGKTTTVRLLAAMLRTQGLRVGHACTDGVFVNGLALTEGDYSGPAGARSVLRHGDVEAAVLESARGGMLRRGLALDCAQAAVVTNISADHFGEYGVHSLHDLAEVKLIVARGLNAGGVLVLNADDPLLLDKRASLQPSLAWFSLDFDHPHLRSSRAGGGSTCGVRHGHLWISDAGVEHDLGAVATMPLTAMGQARHNISNIAAAVLLAQALEVGTDTLRRCLASFGNDPADNPGRLQPWQFGQLQIFLDYAHNPDGLRALLQVATVRRPGRLLMLLGQAGNRDDQAICDLAAVAAEFRPERVIVKDIDGYLRGREAGEVAAVLRESLLRHGLHADQVETRLREIDAVRAALSSARDDDVLVLPVHALSARQQVNQLLQTLKDRDWRAGQALPD